MALILEDGTGFSNSNTYLLSATADAYFALRGNTVWAALATAQKEVALVLAIDFMQQSFRARWQGQRYIINQALDWPRINVQLFDSPSGYGIYPYYIQPGTIPIEVLNAQCELAVRASSVVLIPDIDRVEDEVAVGTIKVKYDDNGIYNTVYPVVNMMLKPYFNTSGINTSVGRM